MAPCKPKDPVKKKQVLAKTHMRGRNGKKVSIKPSLVGDMRAVGSFVAGGREDSGLSWRKGEDHPSLLSSVLESLEPDFPPPARAPATAPAPVLNPMSKNVRKPNQLQERRAQKDDLTISENDTLFGIGSAHESPPPPTTTSRLKADRDAKADKRSKALLGLVEPKVPKPCGEAADDLDISDNDSLFGIGSDNESQPVPTPNHSAGTSQLKADRAAKRSKALLGLVDPKVPKPRGEAAAKVTKPVIKPATKSRFTGWAASLLGSGPEAKKK